MKKSRTMIAFEDALNHLYLAYERLHKADTFTLEKETWDLLNKAIDAVEDEHQYFAMEEKNRRDLEIELARDAELG